MSIVQSSVSQSNGHWVCPSLWSQCALAAHCFYSHLEQYGLVCVLLHCALWAHVGGFGVALFLVLAVPVSPLRWCKIPAA
jgi:hypothetical protein